MTHQQLKLYLRIREARKDRGYPLADINQKLEGHEMEGQHVYNVATGEKGRIQSVHKQWHDGWYITIDVNYDGSGESTMMWENIDCRSNTVLHFIAKNRNQIKLQN